MFKRVMALPLWQHGLLSAAAFGVFQWVKMRLDNSYAASGHPVDYATGQLAFDASKIESYYAVMQKSPGLGVYWTTQFIDFGFIASVLALGFLLGTLVARLGTPGSWGRRMGLTAAGFAIGGAAMDAVENLLSFVMLQNPAEIPQALALAYSSAAATKFALLGPAVVVMLVALPFGLWSRLRK